MKIGAKLAELRRKQGLTQEQLAERLGVSAPAVSKWETDNSYPDITLLCPLARVLGTNVDTLLQFEEQLPNEEVIKRVNAIVETARQKGWEEGEKLLNGLLRQYPNSDALKYNAALAQNAFQLLYPDADREVLRQWTARKVELLNDIHATGTGGYWESATLMLAQAVASDGRLDEAERLLKELPEQGVDPTVAWAQISMMRGNPEEALKYTQKRLHVLVLQVQACLTMMISGVVSDGERVLELCRISQDLDRLFGLGGLYDGLFLEAYLRMGRWEEAADRLNRYVDAMAGTAVFPRPDLFAPGVECREKPVSSPEICLLLSKQLREEERYRPILQYEKGREAVEKLEAKLSSNG